MVRGSLPAGHSNRGGAHKGGVHGEPTSGRPSTGPANTPNASSRARPQTKQRLNTPSDRPPVARRREPCLMRAHRCWYLDVELGRRTRDGDERLAVEHPHRAVALAHDIERRVERHRTTQTDLRCPPKEVGYDTRAVPAVAALERPVEATRYGHRLGHKADYLTPGRAAPVHAMRHSHRATSGYCRGRSSDGRSRRPTGVTGHAQPTPASPGECRRVDPGSRS